MSEDENDRPAADDDAVAAIEGLTEVVKVAAEALQRLADVAQWAAEMFVSADFESADTPLTGDQVRLNDGLD